ncbi:heterokaryon incompatibility protein-domain-containing protein [Halenospora varia]|nr:heterokaryon incompatibility protein-domain-containing protein [Halenospora varia]
MWSAFDREWRHHCPNIEVEISSLRPVFLSIRWSDEWISQGRAEKTFPGAILAAHWAHFYISTSFLRDIEGELDEKLAELGSRNDSNSKYHGDLAPILHDSTTISHGNMELARLWIKNCSENHVPCQQLSVSGMLPRRVIDISDIKKPFLADGCGRKLPYATLSYMWGEKKRVRERFQTTIKSISNFQHRLPLERMPQTFKDVLFVAHELGFSYLWIDQLCIQQDCPRERDEQMKQMDNIYMSSALTIFAAVGENPDTGLGVGRDQLLLRPSKVHLRATAKDWTHQGDYYIKDFGFRTDTAPLFNRGWVLQEEILSARTVLFGKDEMVWRYQYGRGGVLDEWYPMVERYTRRQLTYSSDTLPALSGIASRISQSYKYSFVAGLWREDIQLGLLWLTDTPTAPLHIGKYTRGNPLDSTQNSQRLVTRLSKLASGFFKNIQSTYPANNNGNDRDRVSKFGNPSWSWISQFNSGRSVVFDHYGKYILKEEDSIKILDIQVIRDPSSQNPFGEILSATLRVRARIKRAEVLHRTKSSRIDYPKAGDARIYYQLIVPTSDQKKRKYVGQIYPDSTETVERITTIYCVLCAVAPLLHSPSAEDSSMYTAIGVVPSSVPNQFIRVGLVQIRDEAWFGPSHLPEGEIRDDFQIIELV